MIWSTLFASKQDEGLESTGLRGVFEWMDDLDTAPVGFERLLARKPDNSGWESLMVRKANGSGWENFEVTQNG